MDLSGLCCDPKTYMKVISADLSALPGHLLPSFRMRRTQRFLWTVLRCLTSVSAHSYLLSQCAGLPSSTTSSTSCHLALQVLNQEVSCHDLLVKIQIMLETLPACPGLSTPALNMGPLFLVAPITWAWFAFAVAAPLVATPPWLWMVPL